MGGFVMRMSIRIRLRIASVFPRFWCYFHKNIAFKADDFQANREYLTNQRRSDPSAGESRQGPSGEPATELAERTGNWVLRDGTEKALTTNVMTEGMGSAGSARKYQPLRSCNQL